MDTISEFVDVRHKAWCIHCGVQIAMVESNRDHVPSKSLLLDPLPDNLPVVDVCRVCNTQFSLDEEYLIALLGCVISGSTEPERQRNPRVQRILHRSPTLKARIELAKTEYTTLSGETQLVWSPESERINRIIVKNARGHAFFEYGEPIVSAPNQVACLPLASLSDSDRRCFELVDIENDWPEVGSRMMTRLLTGQDLVNGWIIVQNDVYRYAISRQSGMVVRTVLFEYLATEVYWNEP